MKIEPILYLVKTGETLSLARTSFVLSSLRILSSPSESTSVIPKLLPTSDIEALFLPRLVLNYQV